MAFRGGGPKARDRIPCLRRGELRKQRASSLGYEAGTQQAGC